MNDEMLATDDQSHYEISLTAGQAFLAFVLLLLSLAASFAFGLMIGRGQADERLVVRKEPAVITEGSAMPGAKKPDAGRIVELGVPADDFKAKDPAPPATETVATPVLTESVPVPSVVAGSQPAAPSAPEAKPVVEAPKTPVYAQLLSTADQKTAESLATKLIERGFTSAYVERGTSDKGPIFRVRIKFPSEADAHAAEPKLKEFSKDVWIVK